MAKPNLAHYEKPVLIKHQNLRNITTDPLLALSGVPGGNPGGGLVPGGVIPGGGGGGLLSGGILPGGNG